MKASHSLLTATGMILAITTVLATLKLMPLHNQHRSNEAALRGTETRMAELRDRIHTLPALKVDLSVRNNEQGRLTNLLIHPDSLTSAVQKITEFCSRHQLSIKRVTAIRDTVWVNEPESDFSAPLTLLLRMEGRYLDYGFMIDNSHQLPFFFQITDFQMVRPENGSTLVIEASASIRLRKAMYAEHR